jgi:hypothetical protein
VQKKNNWSGRQCCNYKTIIHDYLRLQCSIVQHSAAECRIVQDSAAWSSRASNVACFPPEALSRDAHIPMNLGHK